MKKINYENYYWQNDIVRLRAMEPEDWEEHYYNCYDSKARRMLQSELELPPTISKNKSAIEDFSDFNDTKRLMFTIESLDGVNVGSFNLNSIDERNGTFSIGIQIGRNHRGKGYGTSAMKLLLDYAFNERRLNKFNVSILEGNVESSKMLKKLGCKEEGVRREVIYAEGGYKNEILFGLTKDEYNETLMKSE